jgi:peptidoglycan/LPS O-acetylase OafA/YrhL
MKNPKKHLFLDGLRGMAAMFVVTCHTGDYWKLPFQHAYLAVDLFFLISGFVIANAYEEKLKGKFLSRKKFLIIRVIRLYPMFLISLVFGTTLAFGRSILSHHADILNSTQVIHAFLFNAFFLPSHLNGNESLFPLNGLYWSLLFELIVNALYAVSLPLLENKVLISVIALFGAVIATISIYNGNMDLGFSWHAVSLLAGFSRATFGIFFGVFIYRNKTYLLNNIIRKTGFVLSPGVSFLLIGAIFVAPALPLQAGIFDAVVVVGIFPLLVLRAIDGTAEKTSKLMLYLGAASYPMYVFQAPAQAFVQFIGRGAIERYAPVSGVIFLVSLTIFSVWIERRVDLPVRKFIYERLFPKQPENSHGARTLDQQSPNLIN